MNDGDAENESGSSSRTTDRRTVRKPSPLAGRVHDLIDVIKDLGDEPSPGAVHALRTTIRRVETLLPAEDETTGGERKVRKQLDRLRKRAGKVRDVDVHVKALRSVRRAVAPDALTEVRDALQKARAKRERKLVRAVGAERDRGLVKRLRRAVARAEDAAHPHADAAGVVARVSASFDDLVRAAMPLGSANLHQLRIATKRLRYRVEPYLPDAAAELLVGELKRVQDAAGTWHDWATLGERIVDVLGGAGSPLVGVVQARTERALSTAVRTTERVAARLRKASADRAALAPAAARKAPRAMTAGAIVRPSSAGASS